jgi:hypothetical protein
LFALATTFGLMIAEGPQANGRIGQEPERPFKVGLAFGFFVATMVIGGYMSKGSFGRRTAGWVLAGWLIMALSMPWIVGTAGVGRSAWGWIAGLTGLVTFFYGLRLNRWAEWK